MAQATLCPHPDRPMKAKGLCRQCWGKTRPWGGAKAVPVIAPLPRPRAVSQRAAILTTLIHAGSAGLDPIMAQDLGLGLRLSARIKELRTAGNVIETMSTRTLGGAVIARYVLLTAAAA